MAEEKKKRNLNEHLVVGYPNNFALIPHINKVPDGKIEFIEQKMTPPGPVVAFANGVVDLFLTNDYQLAYRVTTARIASFGGDRYLLVAHDRLDEARSARMVHKLLLELSKLHPDFMLFPKFALKYSSDGEYNSSIPVDIYDTKGMD